MSELKKMRVVQYDSQIIGEFIDWLGSQGRAVCYLTGRNPEWVQWPHSTERLLAEYFDINLDKVEQEKRQILAELRAGQVKP